MILVCCPDFLLTVSNSVEWEFSMSDNATMLLLLYLFTGKA